MSSIHCTKILKTAVLGIAFLLLAVGLSSAQQQINLAAGPANFNLPDGSTVPMWGYTCGAVVNGSLASCRALNPSPNATWSPVVITVPTGQNLQINLTNNLSFANGNKVPTSLVIVGQLGGGLGTTATTVPSPNHAIQGATWPIAGDTSGAAFTPPAQGPRVQSFSTEVAAGATTSLTWTTPRAGTYLLESGTHPSIQGPMGLYGIVVVTAAPANNTTTGTAYPGVTYNAEVPLIFSEIDPNQNKAVTAAVNTAGFSENATIVLRDSVSAINLATDANGNVLPGAGGSGYSVGNPITLTGGGGTGATAVVAAVGAGGAITAINVTNGGTGYSSAPVALATTGGSGANLVAALSLAGTMCSNGAACYPPAVNYTPLYYLVNGVAFDKTNSLGSLFPAAPGSVAAPVTGSILVRMVNAGLRMHVPSIVGATSNDGANTPGFALIAEDGNPLPGVPRVQSEVFMAAGKTYDVKVNVPTNASALPVFDRQLSLSGNATQRDAGMLAYIGVNGSTAGVPAAVAAAAVADTYNSVIPGQTLTISDPAQGVIANDVNIYGVKVISGGSKGTLNLNPDGTFTYAAPANWTSPDTFIYCGNGATSGAACATVTLNAATKEPATGITVSNKTFTSRVATYINVAPPGILTGDKDAAGYPLAVATAVGYTPMTAGLTLTVQPNGGFIASVPGPGTYTFSYKAQNSQGTQSGAGGTANNGVGTVTLVFPTPTNLAVTVLDGADKATRITDYRWIIEEDRTFYVDPTKTTNAGTTIVPTFGTNFHTSYMPVVAQGCTGPLSCESGQTVLDPVSGTHVKAICDVGNGICRPDTTGNGQVAVDPKQVYLDPTKRYYISVLPGDAANPFANGYVSAPACANALLSGVLTSVANGTCGHGMGGAPISFGQTAVTVLTQPSPYPPAKLSVFVFEDDFPLNGENDSGGNAPGSPPVFQLEPGLGGFQITIFDDAGGTGDATGQPTYDMFNMPLSNSLAGTIDPVTGADACPISVNQNVGFDGTPSPQGITGMIVTCPNFEADGVTPSPLAGQAVIANLYPGRYGVVATPNADRIARGEEWLQTNTLDGQKAHDSFLRIGEPSYFQEFGPAGYHVSIGFANPAIINARHAGVCNGSDLTITGTNCTNSITGQVTTERMSRTPDERLYSSGDYSSFGFTQCYVSFGDPDGEDFAFTKCNADGTFTLSGLPDGDWRVTVFDQWNDMLVDGLSTPVRLAGGNTVNMGNIAMNQWQANIYTSTFFDQNGNGVRDGNEPGLTLVPTNIRFRDGSYSNFNNTDLAGNAGFNEVFPLFSWYVIETDSTRFKNTGTHVVYDAGGPADGNPCGSATNPPTAPCGNSSIASMMANTAEIVSVPTNQRVPGAVYCASGDCTGKSIASGPASSDPPSVCSTNSSTGATTCTTQLSTGRIDPPWVVSEGWQGFSGQNSFLEFGKKPFAAGENGGIHGHVIYASTRPFDDPQLLLQTSWEPLVPGVTINLYQVKTAADGSRALTLVDTTKTSSWDDWAQGFRSDGVPNMNCPGQGAASGPAADVFFFTLYNQPMWLDAYNNGGNPASTLPANSQFKCFDGMHNWNQLQPAPYDGMYQFPSVTAMDPVTGKPTGTNCTACIPNPDTTDPYRTGTPMLPAGKYVVEIVVPPGYELVKEEDKNILIGDNYIAPVTQQFAGLGNIFILPDQAAVGSTFNPNNPQNPTQGLGRIPTLASHEGDTGSVETFWPCVGQSRIVPDYISLFPQSMEVSPFAGATRNLCDRKEVILEDQSSALAKFYIFTSTHVAAHFTGVITDDYTSEFDPFSPQFGEKFSPPNMPISIKDWAGNEISRIYADQWGTYNGLTYSTWEVNPPNPTGYAPTMMVVCMNDPGTGPTPDPLFNPQYSQFCYEIPFMPGQTQYMDTPVVPTSAFAGAGYNNPDCNYPDATPAIKEVDSSDGVGPWVSAAGAGHTLTITALGDVSVPNNAYSGPSATSAPYNAKTVTRHYGFGSAAGTVALVGSDGVSHPLTGVSWSDTTITGTVPTGVPSCSGANGRPQPQQQAIYGGSAASCGQLVVTAKNGKQSIDTVTVTIGGKRPTHVAASASIQAAIDAAQPGDMLIIDPTCTTAAGPVACTTAGAVHSNSSHNEILIMWKPVRLQGVGAASSIINANTQPAGKLDPWRQRVNCLFGLALNGQPFSTGNPFDSTGTVGCPGTGWNGFVGTNSNNPQVDRLPLEAVVGWSSNLNGNLAELLQEPTLMGALEGAAITVLAKGVKFPAGSNPWSDVDGAFPVGSLTLKAGDCLVSGANPYPSNFNCNPSSIDGLGITDSSQGGGGIFVHGWAHMLQIANNRIYNNAGTLSGGINLGQGEFAPAYTVNPPVANADPGSCNLNAAGGTLSGLPTGAQQPYCFNLNVNVHNNSITSNSSTGDELFSATPAGAGGVSICTGADYYKFNYNWVCGNLSSGDGGGIAHMGFSFNGDIEHNTILFNQSTNPTIPTNGGGLVVMGTPDADPPCSTVDQDCLSAPGTIGPSDGAGPGLMINANLFMGNAAESGSGGGLRLQAINGSEVVTFPTTPSRWYKVTVQNNFIVNNVAGWDGGGVSLLDALNTDIINNTIASNDSTASAGILFNTLGAPIASSEGSNCIQSGGTTRSCPQPAGLVAVQNSSVLKANLPATITCPANHFSTAGGGTASNGTCRNFSYPRLDSNILWQNRSFYIGVGSLGIGGTNQQNVVALYNAFTNTPAASQNATGACPTASYWDLGVRGDTGPTNHASSITLNPTYSVMTSTTGYAGTNKSGNPLFVSQYCNGSRIPPEFGGTGYQVPPGIADATVPNPIFNLTPAATVDEGNNWINISWGPLAMANASKALGSAGYGVPLGNYILQSTSSSANSAGDPTAGNFPTTDFFGTARTSPPEAGAYEIPASSSPVGGVTPTALNFGNVAIGFSNTLGVTVFNSGIVALPVGTPTVSGANYTMVNGCPASLGITPPGNSCSITVTLTPTGAAGVRNGTLTVPVNGVNQVVSLTGNAVPAPTFTVSGTIQGAGGSGATVTLTQGATVIATVTASTTPAGGPYTYSFTGVSASGTAYTVTPTHTGYIFAPTSQNVTVTNANVIVPPFVATPVATYSVSGSISGAGGSGATVTLTQGATVIATVTASTTPAGGPFTYSFASVPSSGTAYTVTPSNSGFTFAPTSQNVSVTTANVTNVNFTATAVPTFTVSGTISGPGGNGATVTLTQGATVIQTVTATTTAPYTYTFNNVASSGTAYTVTPAKTGFTFSPASQNATVTSANVVVPAFVTNIAIDATVNTQSNVSGSSITSPAFTTTAANELLLAFVATDDTGSGTDAYVNSVTGCSLTWVRVNSAGASSLTSTTARGTAAIYRAFAPTAFTCTGGVTANITAGAGGAAKAVAAQMIVVMSFANVDPSGTNGSGAIGSTGTRSGTGAPSVTLATTRGYSLALGVGNDYDTRTTRTLGTGQVIVVEDTTNTTVTDDYWVQRRTTPAATLPAPTINDTAPTADHCNLVAVEVLPAP